MWGAFTGERRTIRRQSSEPARYSIRLYARPRGRRRRRGRRWLCTVCGSPGHRSNVRSCRLTVPPPSSFLSPSRALASKGWRLAVGEGNGYLLLFSLWLHRLAVI